MASAFVVGDKFRNKVTHLLGKSESALPRALGEELEEVLEKPEPTILPFSTARKIKKYLQDNGEKRKNKILNYVCVCVCVYNFITFFTWLHLSGHPFYLHELLEDSSLHLPEIVKPPRVSKFLHVL